MKNQCLHYRCTKAKVAAQKVELTGSCRQSIKRDSVQTHQHNVRIVYLAAI